MLLHHLVRDVKQVILLFKSRFIFSSEVPTLLNYDSESFHHQTTLLHFSCNLFYVFKDLIHLVCGIHEETISSFKI